MKEIIQEKIMTPKSSLIQYVIYDYHNEVLQVKYKRGKRKGQLKTYKNISTQEYEWIMSSDSQGKSLLYVLAQKKEEDKSFFSFFKNLFGGKKGGY